MIIGARTVAQLEDNLRAVDVKPTAEDGKELDEASQPSWTCTYAFVARQQQPW